MAALLPLLLSLLLFLHLPSPGLSLPLSLSPSSSTVSGSLFLATCNLPSCTTLSLANFNLTAQTATDLYDFPFDAFEDSYVADNVLVNTTFTLSLQYDNAPAQGFLLSYDTATNKIVGGFNSTFCFNLFLDPLDPSGDSLLCLAVVPCKGATQCSQIHRLSRSRQTDVRLSSFLPDYAPYTVSTMDTHKNLIYSTFTPLSGAGGNIIAVIDATTGKLVSQVPFPDSTAFIELEFDAVSGLTYAVIEQGGKTFAGTVDLTSGVGAPLGPNAYLNTTYWNQFNTISTIAPEIGVLFTTAFHYALPVAPFDPVLHLLGFSLQTGEIVYDSVVQNPFCEIAWMGQ